ncbi:MAG: sensor histidine kinase [Oceanospirillaceae bacterium]|nr:sensor histidine kinase [Oceanospirillaceae bacterium]
MRHFSSSGRERSLERLIRHRLLLVLLLVSGILLALLHLAINALTADFVRSRLEHDAESLIAAVQPAGDGWRLTETALPLVYQRARSGHYFLLQYGDQRLRSRSLWDLTIDSRSLPVGASRSYEQQPPVRDQYWLILEQGFRKGDTDFSLWIAEDIAPLRSIQYRYELYALVPILLSIPLLLLWQGLVLRRGFARLEPLRRALAEQSAGSAAELPSGVPTEVQPLVDAIRQRLNRSGEQIQRSRTALGNLAHELKRPLQRLQWLAENCEQEAQRRSLWEVHDQLRQRIDSELRRARIAGVPSPGQQFVPAEEVPHLVRLLELSGRGDIRLQSRLPDGAMPFDRDDMIELLGNLLDNGWRYACTQVCLCIERGSGGWVMRVEDDGPGVKEADLERLTQRGLRLDEQEQGEGHGLGLSICAAVVASYDGHLEFRISELGGLCVEAFLPG